MRRRSFLIAAAAAATGVAAGTPAYADSRWRNNRKPRPTTTTTTTTTTPPPTTTTPPPPPPTGVPTLTGTTYFSEDFASGDFRNFGGIHNVPNGFGNVPPGSYDQSTYHLKVVDVGGDHGNVARFEVHDGDSFDGGSTERCELMFPSSCEVSEGDERWYQFDIRLGDPTWNNSQVWELNWQWHHEGNTGSPPLTMESRPEGTMTFAQPGFAPLNGIWNPLWTISPGTWERITWNVKFSTNPAIGFVRIWRNLAEVFPKEFRATMLDAHNYPKCGIYRAGTSTNTQIVMFDNIKVASAATVP